jgi:hypothetical protein|tara:strand:- start:956 stop:1129 length:174 start_codon:yes stop_codon:yes gene_type:complete
MRKIDPKEYMLDGWDRQGKVRYVRGSTYNKVMMTGMWVYYILFAVMFFRGLILFLNR